MSLNTRTCLGSLMPRKPSFYLIWAAVPVLTMLNQACVKHLASAIGNLPLSMAWLSAAAHSVWTFGILGCEIVSFGLWMTILSTTSISKATPLSAIAYILILAMSWMWFREPMLPLQLIGSVLILTGVWLIGTAHHDAHEPDSMPTV